TEGSEPIRLSRSDRWTVGLALAAAILSILFASRTFRQVFPEASIQLKVNRAASERIARSFLARQGVRVNGYRHAAIFYYSDSQKVYLDRTLGLARMSRLTSGPVHLWRWEHRWFKPQQEEEYEVAVAVDGSIARYLHRIPEDSPGARLSEAAARTIAERYLRDVVGRDPGGLTIIGAYSVTQLKRLDHYFTWKQKNVDLGDGSLRYRIDVSGNQVTGFGEWVYIPQRWDRDYQGLRSRNRAMQSVADLLELLLQGAMLIFLARRVRDRDVPVRLAILVGGAGAAMSLLSRLNQFPTVEYYYATKDSFAGFTAWFVGNALFHALLSGLQLALVVASAEPLYRSSFPRQLSVRRVLSWRGLRTRSFMMAMLVGLALTPLFIAYQCLYYLVARHFGAWNPVQVPVSALLSSSLPWATVLIGGFFPAVNEEMTFRAFAVPFWKRILRYWPAAYVLSSFQWGFLHSAYPNQPFFIRGLEVGAAGLFAAFIMLRFGILATLVYHYSLDAFYDALVLMHSPQPYLVISAALAAGILIVPLAVAVVAYWRTGTFLDGSSLTNASEGSRRHVSTPAPPPADPALRYNPMSLRRLMLAAVLTTACLASLLIPAPKFGADARFRLNRADALQAAERFMAAHRYPPGRYYSVVSITGSIDLDLLGYFLERLPVPESERIYRLGWPPSVWLVRMFRPLHPDTFNFYVDSETGRINGYYRYIPEDSPGPSLSTAQARQLALRSLHEEGYDLAGFSSVYSSAERRKQRTDYTFAWEAPSYDLRRVDRAKYRVWAMVQGSEVTEWGAAWRLPDGWIRRRDAVSTVDEVLSGLGLLATAIGVVGVVILGVQQLRRPNIRWRNAGWIALAFAGVTLVHTLLQLSTFLMDYPTADPLPEYVISAGEALFRTPLLVGIAAWPLVSLSTGLYPEFWLIFRPAARRAWRRDAIVAGAVAVAGYACVTHMTSALFALAHEWAPVIPPAAPVGIDTY
ncbi:MAG: CPBP family intramembrane metalloprotease, partial [Chloroflexi bacterium]|nr:CPBP family intramembrane metalloprotease [Chloroflexota bacterium]